MSTIVSKATILGYLGDAPEDVINQVSNILESHFHKTEGKILKTISEANGVVTLTFSDDTNKVFYTKEELDNIINPLLNNQVSGFISRKNRADLPAVGDVDTAYFVLDDATDPELNGTWGWDGSAYYQGYKPPQIEENGIVKGSQKLSRSGDVYKEIVNRTEKDLFYLNNPSALSDTERAKYVSIKDIKFDIPDGNAYADYEYAMVYLGKDDATFNSIWWVARRVDENSAWETHTMFTGGTQLQVEDKWFEISETWDGVTITLLLDTTLLQDALITFQRDIITTKSNFTKQEYFIAKDIGIATEKELFYLDNSFSLSSTERAKYVSIKDIKFDIPDGNAYADYEYAMVYLGKDDATFNSIWWVARRADENSAWETHTMFTGGTQLQVEDKWFEISGTWDGVTITLLLDTTLLQDALITFQRDIITTKSNFTKQEYFLHLELEKKADASAIAIKEIPTNKNIVLAGSSITWKDGNLKNGFGGKLLEYIRKNLSNYVGVDDATFTDTNTPFSNPKLFDKAKQISGIGSKINFSIYGDELAICQVIKRTSDFAKIQVKADRVVIGSFTNHNNTLGSGSDSFIGNGTDIKFELTQNATYNHSVTVNGVAQTVKIHNSAFFSFPVGFDAVIVRKLNSNGDVVHMIWFANPPSNGHAVVVNYDYGRVITEELSSVGQTTTDSINESNFGDGDTSFDPANPSSVSSGLEFRSVNKDAFFVHKFTSKATRNIELEIIEGTNPYFIFNFATNRFHNYINAGIGGWTVANFANTFYPQSYKNLYKNFTPNTLITEFATNDDWGYSSRRLSRSVSGLSEAQVKDLRTLEINSITFDNPNYTVDFSTGIITSVSAFSLISSQIVGSSVQAGDLVRIGNYHGDNKQVAVREISSVNTTTGEIKWKQPISADEILNINEIDNLIGAEVSIRDLSGYKTAYQNLIDKIKAISGAIRIIIAQPGLSNYFMRQLWGYDIVHRDLANENYNVGVVEITDELQDFQNNHITGDSYEEVTANGSTSYNLAKTGHWQGFKVWVNGKNVYGKDCYIKSGQGYKVNQSNTGADLAVGAYSREQTVTEAMELVFTQNAPSSGTVRIEYADVVWSGDYAHTNSTGDYLYTQKYIEKI